ncbi:hypothetical protein SAMN04487881_0061 [Marinobacter sp. es.048]|nr:hypothetical protein SAMN04487881_0061 [Marinobacter sp. es.048]
MEEILKVAGSVAGIGGLALGVFLILFQKLQLPRGTRKHLTLFMWLVWSICVIGIAAYILGTYWSISPLPNKQASAK